MNSEIRERHISVNISDEECEALAEKCRAHGITISELFQNFVGDITGGIHSNGSDECFYANQWFERCYFGVPEKNLLTWFYSFSQMEYFLEYLDNLETAYDELQLSEKEPDLYDEEQLYLLHEDIEYWEKEIHEYKKVFMKDYPNLQWDAEIKRAKEWNEEYETFTYNKYKICVGPDEVKRMLNEDKKLENILKEQDVLSCELTNCFYKLYKISNSGDFVCFSDSEFEYGITKKLLGQMYDKKYYLGKIRGILDTLALLYNFSSIKYQYIEGSCQYVLITASGHDGIEVFKYKFGDFAIDD